MYLYTKISLDDWKHIYVYTYSEVICSIDDTWYGMATIPRILQIMILFCKRAQ